MKTITKILFAIIATALLYSCGDKTEFDEKGYKIIKFQDSKLEESLLAIDGADQNQDGKLSIWEMARITKIDCENKGIAHATELKYCMDADTLLFAGNNITDELDLSRLEKLETADFSDNSLRGKFDMSQMASLVDINLSGNNIESLPGITETVNLKNGDFSNNNLSGTIDIYKHKSLVAIDFTGNSDISVIKLSNIYIGNADQIVSRDQSVKLEYINDSGENVTPEP